MAEATHDEGANDAQVTAERYRLLVGGLSVIIAILLGLAMLAPSFVHPRVPLTAAGALAVITGGSLAIERQRRDARRRQRGEVMRTIRQFPNRVTSTNDKTEIRRARQGRSKRRPHEQKNNDCDCSQ